MNEVQASLSGNPQTCQAGSLSAWADAIRNMFVDLQISPHKSGEVRGSVVSGHWAHLMASSVRSTAQTFNRTSALVSSGPANLFQVGLVGEGSATLEQDGRSCTLQAGDFAIYETSRPFSWSLGTDDWRLLVYTWPREAISLADTESQRLTARRLDGSSGVARILSPMFKSLVGTNSDVSAANAARVADQLAELAITAALEEAHDEPSREASPELIRRILLHIEQHIGDPNLSPTSVAQEFFISTRTLHRLFAAQGETVGSWIRLRRLEACRRAMLSPHRQNLSLTEVASLFGFADLAVFSRSFASRYGVSPRRYRQTHLDAIDGAHPPEA